MIRSQSTSPRETPVILAELRDALNHPALLQSKAGRVSSGHGRLSTKAELEARTRQTARRELIRTRSLLDRAFSPPAPVNLPDLLVQGARIPGHGIAPGTFKHPLRDWIGHVRSSEKLVLVLSDGASCCPLSHLGAELLVRLALDALADKDCRNPLSELFLTRLYTDLYGGMSAGCEFLEIAPGQAHALAFAATIQVLIATPMITSVLAISDGFVSLGHRHLAIAQATGREIELQQSGLPPFLSTALAADSGNTDLFASSRVVADLFRHDVSALRLVHAGPTLDLSRGGIWIHSDGVAFCEGFVTSQRRDRRFPYMSLLGRVDESHLRGLMELWDMAARSQKDRDDALQLLNDALRDVCPPLGVSDKLIALEDDVSSIGIRRTGGARDSLK